MTLINTFLRGTGLFRGRGTGPQARASLQTCTEAGTGLRRARHVAAAEGGAGTARWSRERGRQVPPLMGTDQGGQRAARGPHLGWPCHGIRGELMNCLTKQSRLTGRVVTGYGPG